MEAAVLEAPAASTPAAPTAPKPIDFNLRVGQYVMLRDKIKELDDMHKEKMKPFRETLEQLGNVLLGALQSTGQDSAKCAAGTVFKTEKTSVSLEDPDAFMRHVIGSGEYELLDRKANVTACEEFLQQHETLPPGVKMSKRLEVNVRRSSSSKEK